MSYDWTLSPHGQIPPLAVSLSLWLKTRRLTKPHQPVRRDECTRAGASVPPQKTCHSVPLLEQLNVILWWPHVEDFPQLHHFVHRTEQLSTLPHLTSIILGEGDFQI